MALTGEFEVKVEGNDSHRTGSKVTDTRPISFGIGHMAPILSQNGSVIGDIVQQIFDDMDNESDDELSSKNSKQRRRTHTNTQSCAKHVHFNRFNLDEMSSVSLMPSIAAPAAAASAVVSDTTACDFISCIGMPPGTKRRRAAMPTNTATTAKATSADLVAMGSSNQQPTKSKPGQKKSPATSNGGSKAAAANSTATSTSVDVSATATAASATVTRSRVNSVSNPCVVLNSLSYALPAGLTAEDLASVILFRPNASVDALLSGLSVCRSQPFSAHERYILTHGIELQRSMLASVSYTIRNVITRATIAQQERTTGHVLTPVESVLRYLGYSDDQ